MRVSLIWGVPETPSIVEDTKDKKAKQKTEYQKEIADL